MSKSINLSNILHLPLTIVNNQHPYPTTSPAHLHPNSPPITNHTYILEPAPSTALSSTNPQFRRTPSIPLIHPSIQQHLTPRNAPAMAVSRPLFIPKIHH